MSGITQHYNFVEIQSIMALAESYYLAAFLRQLYSNSNPKLAKRSEHCSTSGPSYLHPRRRLISTPGPICSDLTQYVTFQKYGDS